MRMNKGKLSEEFYEDIEGKILSELYNKYLDLLIKQRRKNKKIFIVKKSGLH